MASTKIKAASDFTHLFELFDRLASRRRSSNSTIPDDLDVRSVPVPEDLEPVFRNLVSLIGTRNHQVEMRSGSRTTRRKTVSASVAPVLDSDSTESDEGAGGSTSNSQFPPGGKAYPFTFKMMLHKLYKLEEWGKKVRDVLEKSQNDYKSLVMQEEGRTKGSDSRKGVKGKGKGRDVVGSSRVEFAAHVDPSQRRTVVAPGAGGIKGRPRSHTVAGTNGRSGITRAAMVIPQVITPPPEPQEGVKAVKKRCIGRRKSLGGKSDWIYDTAVASREVGDGRRIPFVGRSSYTTMNKNDGQLGREEDRPVIVRRKVISVSKANSSRSVEVI
ncbi:hypothetical protein L218DRAFT_985377 [Marasmius fiardii PR-910]|nr:hypothetical protein L218DRAFT_985377 [Marasmius fiardii PR-910]